MKNPSTKPLFPFTAVIGQEALKSALTLAAIDPLLGGVLISGPRGSAKSTLARGLAGLDTDAPERFITLPLGATEEQLIGTLDLQQVIGQKKVEFSPGLLAKAHGGVLYIDEVNLLPDPLVDALLDVSASGVNYVERDGISHSHQAEFLLVGTMNPDEGELRPQLKDRFGLAVELSNDYDIETRVAVVQQRRAFERDYEGFVAAHAQTQRELQQQIERAKSRLHSVECSPALQRLIAERCIEANVEGLRADLSWQRAAAAHAAWHARDEVTEEDVAAVAEFVLAHRRKPQSTRTPPPPASSPPPPAASDKNSGTEGEAGDWGGMPPQQLATGPKRFLAIEPAADIREPFSPRDATPSVAPRRTLGTLLGYHHPRLDSQKTPRIDWFRTFAARENQGCRLSVLHHKKARQGSIGLNCILLDTSGSTLSQKALSHAKGLLLGIAETAYLAREQLAILAFGNDQLDWVMSPQRAPKDCTAHIEQLKAGGGTPLRQALMAARQMLSQLGRQQPQLQCRTFLLTDGRSRDTVSDITWPSPLWVVDTEQARVKLNRCKKLAQQLNAQYLPLGAAVIGE